MPLLVGSDDIGVKEDLLGLPIRNVMPAEMIFIVFVPHKKVPTFPTKPSHRTMYRICSYISSLALCKNNHWGSLAETQFICFRDTFCHYYPGAMAPIQ